ncbi:Riboflavin biosynthesis protein [Zhongshania aliphaticivorans]|uniref:Riboflavin biosynthesis protein n=1 Tax=Zhongshania aliphaticivorans TaxID=1470434 RepID=A0A5S9MZ51_9GAMM|nr:NADAR family protein [Zhongshania aliphaticivorans]CAA0082435.1 Riboflavin biosynthesis protein [Zhongshania aliphaticivorans]CAA0084217.1 Riboflavin biosynthesis protein [Zhongshania aliphaticivorans]
MFSNKDDNKPLYLTREDPKHPLAAYSKHAFELDGFEWPSVEHYYQAMKFDDADYREQIRQAAHPAEAAKLGKSRKHQRRKDWKKHSVTYMTRGCYIKCRAHTDVAELLLNSGDAEIKNTSQYDYFWGSGRDTRGDNNFGKMLMGVRKKLREETQNSNK